MHEGELSEFDMEVGNCWIGRLAPARGFSWMSNLNLLELASVFVIGREDKTEIFRSAHEYSYVKYHPPCFLHTMCPPSSTNRI